VQNYQDGYPVDVIPNFLIRVWNVDQDKNSNIKITKIAANIKTVKTNVGKASYHTSSILNSLPDQTRPGLTPKEISQFKLLINNPQGVHISGSLMTLFKSAMNDSTQLNNLLNNILIIDEIRGCLNTVKINLQVKTESLKKNNNTHITSLINKIQKVRSFATMDIETMEINSIQVPVAISFCFLGDTKLLLIDHNLVKVDIEQAIEKL